MRHAARRIAIALLATSAVAGAAGAQTGSYPCTGASDLPNPYKLVTGWAQTPRPWQPVNAIAVDKNNNFWAADRCEDDSCKPIIELSPDGKTLKNFGAGLFIEPHQAAVDRDGNVWVADAGSKNGKGMQVTKLSPDGKKGLDIFDAPTGVAVASNGDIFISEGHGEGVNNSRIMKFTKDGKFIKTFATLGSGDGQLHSPHAIAVDSQDRLFIADRSNSRIVVFDKDGKYITAWKQFGRPSGLAVDRNDMLYVADSQSSDDPNAANYNPGCRRGIRIGSTKDGRVQYFIPPPVVVNPMFQPPIGVAVDRNGTIYAGSDDQKDVKKYVKN